MPSKNEAADLQANTEENPPSEEVPEPQAAPSDSKTRPSNTQSLTIVGFVIIVVLAIIYFLTGSDPLGFFTPPTPTLAATATAVQPSASMPAPTGTPDQSWWDVYFTNPLSINDPTKLKGSVPEQLIKLIKKAKKSIHIAAFEFNLTPVAEALVDAHKRGVEVQWVTDDEFGIEADEDPGHGQFAMLRDAGIEVKDDNRSALMHNKFWIFDKRIVWTGSTNITENGNFRNNNNVLVIKSQALANIYEQEFAEMWAGEFGPRSPSTIGDQSLSILGYSIQVLFSSEDSVISKLIPLVDNAQKSIRIMVFSFTYNELEDAVVAAFDRGLDVKALFETRSSETEFSALPIFYCAEIPSRQDGNPGALHHKVIIIDENIVITGSLNLSTNADESNDENTIVITNPYIAERYLQEFDKRWEEAREPDPADMGCE